MNIVGKLSLMIPWSIFLLHSLLSTLQGSYCKLPLLRRTSRNESNATRQKRDLVTAEVQAASRLHHHGTLMRSPPGGSCPQECLNGAACTEAGDCDCQLFQAQGSRCQIVPNTGKDRDGICKSWGQYNFETFDGIYYYFPGNCSYIFAKDCSTLEPQYTVWVHNSPYCYSSVYSCHRSISLFFSNQEEIMISGHEVRKNGIRLILPQTVGNAFIERLADYILVKTTFGFSLAWDGNSGIYIKLTEDHKGKPCGLCGNFNGHKYDDLILQNIGEYTEDIAEFANSWAVQASDDITCVPTASDFSSPCSANAESTEDIFFKCQIFLQFPFLSCHESIDPYSYISSCMNDLCRVDDDETYCRAVTEYARACSHAGSPVRDWRDDFPACTEKCEDTFVHRDCISCCPPTCTFEKDCLGSNLHCLDGCYCPDGLIMENGTCISLSNCPCIYHGTAFPVGSKIEQECSNCICVGGTWNCTDHDCPAECSITGSSHFTTFDGRHFTFLGICQYILVKGTGKSKFTITLQKAPCEQNFDHACIESITLVLEDDMRKQVTLTRYGQIQTVPNQVFNLNGAVEIQNISSFFVQLKTSFGLKILFAKDGERVYVQVDVRWKRRTLGLCGTYNGNLRDDFLSPAGMIEGTPQLHANAWKVSSACSIPINIPVVDPCNVNQQNAGYASHCDIINQDVFAPCHAYISPGLYYQLCRFDACKCGSSCLCNALAHYAHVCGKHGVTIDFRSHVSYCAVMCHSGMLYHQCSSFCKHSCASLSMANICADDCAEGCNCPDGKYFEESVNFCVSISGCHCHYKGKALQPGEILSTPTGSCQCLNGTVKCIEATTENIVHICPEGKIYYDCRSPVPGLPAAGVNCGISCANLAMNFSCVPSPPCASGCICPPGMAEHRGKCYIPDSCPCTWKDREFLSGEVIATPCYTCVCRRGVFNCTSYPCPAVCTIYGDRHYYTFDGLEYDYVSDCQIYLLKSTDNSNISIIAQNKKCFDNDIVCSKNVFITVGDTEIYFSEPSEKQKTLGAQENKSNYQLWKAGYYTVIHFPEQDITILWDKKTMMHVKVGPRWKGKLAGLCGNFDKYTSNDLTTSNNMEVRNAQVFGDSWVLGQCKSPNETLRPCEVHQSKFPYAKKECSILYSDLFAPCRNVIDVTSFIKNCHTDTCNCNLGGDCECLCTSIAAYAHKCCQQGAAIHWRSPLLCAYDCEYYNQGLGEGPYILASFGVNDTIIGANVSSRRIFPLPRTGAHGNVIFSFMITPGLFKDKDLSLSLVSLESAERPNYFLYVHDNETIGLEQWQASASFQRRATFFHHQGLWSPGLSAFELHSKKGFFITLASSSVKVEKYDDSEEFKHSSSFSIEELSASVPYRRMCEWRYESCANPCFKTCSDPEGIACKFLPLVEGCMPYCPKNMILDEVTLRCVYPEDCIPVTPTESEIGLKPSLLVSHMGSTTERFPQTSPVYVTSGNKSTLISVTDKITMNANTASRGINMSAQSITDFYSLEASNAATYSTFSLPSTVEPSDVLHSTASPTVFSKPIPSTDFPILLQASAVTSHTALSNASLTLPITVTTLTTLLSASSRPAHFALLTPTSLVVVPFSLKTSTTHLGTVQPSSALTALASKISFVPSELPTGIGKSRSPSVSHSKGAEILSEVSLSALQADRETFTRPPFPLDPLSTSTSPISTLSARTRSGISQTSLYPRLISALTSIAPQIPMTTRFSSSETSIPQLITVSYFKTANPLSKTSLISENASSSTSFSPKPFSSSVQTSTTVPEQTSPLKKGSISAALPVMTVSSPQVVSQIPKNTSSSPSATYTVSTPVHSLFTSLKPKVMPGASVASKSHYTVPSGASTPLVNSTIFDRSVLSKASTENKHIMHTDFFSLSSISKKPMKSIMSTAFPLRTLALPLNATSVTTAELTDYPKSSDTELKTDPVARSSGTFISKDPSFTRSLSLFTTLLKTPVPSYVTSQTTSYSLIPIVSSTSSLTLNISATQGSASFQDTQATSKIPIVDLATSVDFSKFTLKISLSTNFSTALKTSIVMPSLLTPTASEINLESQLPMPSPPPKTIHISNVSLGKQSSSVSSSEEDGKISAIPAGIITQSTTPMTTNTTVNATSSKATHIFAKMLPSSSASLLVTSGTTLASRITTKTTDSFVVNLGFYMASASVPTTIETHKSLFTTAVAQASQSTRETPKINISKTTSTTSPLSQMKSTSYIASEVKYTTSFEKTVDISEDGQTLQEEKNATKTKTTTDKSSPPYIPITAVQSLLFSRNTTSAKDISISGVLDVTASERSKIPTQKPITPYFSVTEATELQTRAIIDLSHSSGVMALPSSSETTAVADKAYFGTMMHTLISTSSECVPRYLEPVDKCSQYVCVNMGWMLYNLSRNCPKDVQKPDCGFRGMPVQVNTDSCCPEWECPCQCSVLSELSVITFDGNNIALCNMASYVLVKLPGEMIVAHIEKCPANQSANSIRKLVPPANTSGLCFKKLNVTTYTCQILINRLARKVVVDSVIQPLPFSKDGLSIQDTGAMYVVNTPAGISIKWTHVTGIIDIQYGSHSNTTRKTEGLCGVCNGDPSDDLKMQNMTIITNMEEIEMFIKSWEIEKSLDVTTRRPVKNCIEDNCTYCMELLNRSIFIPCHKKVSPQEFCDKMWINSTNFWNYECDALSAYVALCNKHNICIKWRTPDYCSLSCPEGKEYQPCVQPCEAKTCLNKWFYEDSPCSYLREDCVCKNGTILHRTDSDLCIPEEKCTCTDNKGQPRSAGEIWNGSMRGCCMYSCLENGSIIAVEPECSEDPPPVCEREGEVLLHVIEEGACCPKKVCECNMSLCDGIIPTCRPNEKLVVGYHPMSCCPQYRCECDPSVCFNASQPSCREDQFIVEAKQEDSCCFSHLCVCESCIEPVPLCSEGEILTVDLNTIHYCCPHYYCVCDENLCSEPPMICTDDMIPVKEKLLGQCCPEWHCECSCENITMLTCKLGEVKKIDSSVSSACGCTHYICEKDDVCIFQEVTVLNPGQSVIQYLDGDLCYIVQCLQEKDQNTGYNAMHFTMMNCSQQCEAHQVYIPSFSYHTCCGTCQNVSCSFHTENGTLTVYEEGSTWTSNCTNYKCVKTAAGVVVLGSSVVCPPFNDTECTKVCTLGKNGGIVQTYNDGCCKTCSGLGLLPFAISPVVPTGSINCEPGKKEERICQKMTIRTTIRKNDCISQSPINVASCDGKCPSATIFNVNIDSHLRFCKCCREIGTRVLTVPLRCSGNGTEIIYLDCCLNLGFTIFDSRRKSQVKNVLKDLVAYTGDFVGTSGAQCIDCDQAKKPTRIVLMEWTELPKGEDPDYYILTYQQTDAFSQKNVRNISKVERKPISATVLLEESRKYDITIESLKNGRIISVKSFKTRGISENDIKTFVTATTVSFNWSMTIKEFSVSLFLNGTSQIIKRPSGFFVWRNLMPATVYTFKFIFEQLNPEFVNVSQSLDIQAETGTCSQGWVAFQSSCYQVGKKSKPWKVAQQTCEASSKGAHLLDIGSEEEHGFVLSYLQKISRIIMLWTGLNDLKEEGQLLWTDGSPYLLKDHISSLSMIPENQTDCYALQRDPTGPGYFFTGFFCYVQLPYICEYELPLVPENFMFDVHDVKTTEAVFVWSRMDMWLTSGFALILKYYFDQWKPYILELPGNTTQTKIGQLSPGLQYSFLLAARNPEGAQTSLSPILKIETRPLQSQNLEATYVSSAEIHLKWKPPQHSHSLSFHYYLVNILDTETNIWEQLPVEKSKTSIVIQNIKPYHQYQLYLQNVAEKGTLSCHEKPILIRTAVSPPTAVYIHPEDVEEESVILHWTLPQECQESYIQVKPNAGRGETKKFSLSNEEELKVDDLTPGMAYEIAVASVKNGTMSELKTIQCTLKPKPVQIVVPYVLYSNAVVLFVRMPDIGVFDGIYVTSKEGLNATFILKSDGKITIENLTAGREYDFCVFTKSGKMLSSSYHINGVKTCLATPLNVREGDVTDTSIQLSWDRADGDFEQYEVTCTNCAGAFKVQKVKQETATFSNLSPGKLYSFAIRTEKEGFRDSVFVTKEIETVPSAVKYLNCSRDSESITVTWPPAQSTFDGYVLSINNKVFNEKKMLPSGVRSHKFEHLLPGTDFSINIVTRNGLKRSHPTVCKISTYPDPPSDLQVFGQEENAVYFSWKLPRGGFDMFQLSYCLMKKEKLLTRMVYDSRAIVKNLTPGTEYIFQIRTIKGLDSSVAVEKKVITKPAGICGLTLKTVNTSSATVTWNPTKTNFTSYKASLSNSTFTKKFRIPGAVTDFGVTDLTAGGIYNFTLKRLKGNIEGASAFLEFVTEPAKPEGLKFFNVSSYYFSLYWRLPYGLVDRFHVDLVPDHASVVILDLGVREYQADFSNTIPGTTYNATVSAVSSSVYSSPASKTVTTNVTNPGPPVFLAGERVGSAGILLSWNTPLYPNGRILSYIVKYKEVCPWMQTVYTQVTTKPDSLEVLLTSLNPGTTYEIMVAAENSAGIGVFSDPFLFQTAESAPGKVVNLTVEALNSSAVNLIWFLPRQPNGKITSFKISVKHARSGIVVKDVLVKVEDLLSRRLPECNDKSESFLWSTTTPSTTFGKSTILSQTTVAPSTEALSQMSSVWSEPISFVVTNLRPYTTYLFEVSAVTTEAGYIDSAIVRTPESVPEDPPQNFAKSNITAKSFSVLWDPPTIVTGKFSYRVELYGPSGHVLDNSTKDHKFVFSNLVPFTTYDVYVSAETSAGLGPKTNLTVFTPADVPGAVSDLQLAEVEATYIKIIWRKPQQPNGIITQYRVKVHVQETLVTLENTILGDKNKYLIDSLEPYAINENIKPSSPPWNLMEAENDLYEGSAEMFPSIQTASPVIFTSVSGDNLPDISGAAELHPALDNQYNTDILAEELSYVIKGLTPFTDYTISVSAFTAVGEGPPSVLTVRTCEQVPSSVQNISYKNISSSSVLLYWDPPANPNGKIIHYTVYAMELDTKRAFHETTSNNSLLMTGLKKYTNYKMRVAASTAVGESALSEENDVFVLTPEDEPDSPPQNLELINVTATEINLRWLPPEQPNGLITHYEVLYSDSNDFLIKNASSTSISLSDMKPYTLYNISVRAFTRLGYGNQSSFPLLVRTSETVPDSAPENITYRNISSMEIELSFFPPSIPNGIIQTYTIYLTRTNGTEPRVINTTLLTLRIADLNKYTEYTVEVSASTTMGEGIRSSPLRILTDEDAPSSPPQALSVKQLLGVTVKLSWKPPLEPNGIILYYTVYVWNKMSKRSVNVTETSLEFTDLEYNSEYSAYLTASTRFGDGNIQSDTITFRTSEGAPSDPPKDVTYRNLTSTSIVLFWSPPQKPNGNILYYSVYFKNNSGIFIQNFTSYGNDSNVSVSPFVVLDDLAKYSHYTLWLTASTAFGDGNKTSEKIDVYTDQDIPESFVENLVYQNISSTSVNVSWLPPSQPNGLVFFHVSLSLMQLGTSKILSFLTYNTSIIFDDLEKYTDYILKITPATEKGSSEQHALSLHIRTDEDVPESAPVIKTFANLSTTSVMLSWDPPVKPNGIIVCYDLNLFGPEKNNSFSTTNNFIILEDLLPFTLYSIYAAARTIKGPGPSAMLQFYTDESVPLAPPQNLTIINYTADSVWLKWDPSPQSNGVIMRYNFKIYQNNTEKLFFWNISGSSHEANLVGLEPYSPYFISISAFTKLGNGNQFSNAVQFTTMESVPDAVQNMHCIATSWQSILVQWDPPASANGIITHYIIAVEGNSTNFSSYDTLHTFRNLLSNVTYQIKIKAATSAGDGEEQICNASTLPEKVPSAPRDIVFSNVQSTSVTLRWRSPKSILGYFKNYKITTQLQSTHCSDWEATECIEYEIHQYLYENVMDDWIEDTVYGLKKYRWYRFAVAASTNVGYGSLSPWISTQTLPGSPDGPPENVTVIATSPHSINVTWSEPAIITGPTSYLIDVTSVDNDNYKAQFLKTNEEDKALEISDLKAFTRYSVVIIAFTGDVNAALLEGKASSPVIVSTFEAVPEDPPNNITFQKIPDEVTKFQVTFVPPSEPNGNIQVYQAMFYNEDDPAAIQIHNLSVIEKKDQSVTAMIEGLKGGHTYNVSVYAINGAGAGPKIQLKITMDIKEPPRPKKKPAPVYDTNGALLVTDTTITIRMPICYYSDDHGPIKKIQVLVVEAGAQHDGNVTKWYDAYFNRPRPYFTNEGFPNPPCIEGKENPSGKEEIYVIGADTTCLISGSQDKICNGPLKPRRQYLFKFRATNIKGQFTDSDYSDPVKTLGEGQSGRSIEVVLAVALCIFSVVLLVAAVYAFARIRQKQKEGGTYSPRDAEIIDTKFKLDQLITVADLELKDERFTRYSSFFFRRKEIFVIQPISKKSFLQHVEELCTNNNLKFQEEFSELPKFLEDLASTDADLPWNRSKNRFPNIKPYNNNRVKLMPDAGIPGSDYINASYVSGYLCPNEFIATQGPLPGTVGDFWRMVWETRAKTLVMLTQCFEKGRIRCHQYWPEDNKPVTVFGDIVITKLMEEIQVDWTIRDLKIERHGDCMMVRQCNFTSWPEHGVPETTAPIIHFVKLIRASRAHDNTPMVVHCSAGVGRTGVYIALDHLTQHVNDHDFVDIYGLVAELRRERMCMVQNLAQYIFLHQCVLDLLTAKGSSQPLCFVNYSALQKMDSLDAMEGDVELEWEETTM